MYCFQLLCLFLSFFFFFNDTATTEIYTFSLHDALPILNEMSSTARTTAVARAKSPRRTGKCLVRFFASRTGDRKSTRLNSSHQIISYAVFCLKKKNKRTQRRKTTQ